MLLDLQTLRLYIYTIIIICRKNRCKQSTFY
jgi:hypothetical protein